MTRSAVVLVVTLIGSHHVFAEQEARLDKGRALMADIQAALAQPAGQAGASCVVSEPDVSPHRAHGTRAYDYKRELTLSNSVITYNLTYWMNTAGRDGSDPMAIEGGSGLGMNRPAAANWYSNNFLELSYGGEPILKTCLARFTVVDSGGPVARATITWDTPAAQVLFTVELAANAVSLGSRLQVVAKGEPQEVQVGYRAYPGHYPEPRDRRAATPLREVTAPQSVALGTDEDRVVLFDEHDAQMACGLEFSRANPTETLLGLATYGVTVSLHYPAAPKVDCGPVRIWDFAGVSLNSAITQVFEAP